MTRLLLLAGTDQVSGAERVLLSLAALAADRGADVLVGCPDGLLAAALPSGVAHLRLPFLGLRAARVPRALAPADLLRRSVAAAAVVRAAAGPGTAVVVNALLALPAARLALPDGGATWLVHDTVHRRDQALVVRLSRSAVRRAVAVSEATAAPLRQLGLDVAVAPNGVPWPVSPVDPAPHDPPVVGVLALLTPWKGHAVLLDAVARLPGVHLEVAGGAFPGDAAHVARLHARAARPDLRGRVRFLGHVDAAAALTGWDVAVSASTSPEAGPLGVLEAMSRGVPVVGTDHGGTRDYLACAGTAGPSPGGPAGVLVPPGDAGALAGAIARVLTDLPLRDRLAARSRQVVAERHDLARTLPVLLDLVTSP